MKRFLILVLVFVTVFAVSCSKKKSHDYEERVSKKITAEEGGTVESSDGKTSVEIPGGALDEDTTITMTVYESEGYKGTDDVDVITKVIEFEPSGTVFKKPVIITMASEIDVDNKIVSAAVYNESKGEWSYDEHGAYALLLQSKDEDGAPLMTTAGGDPIMLNAGGDPIMMSAGGDPIMLAAAGDPIMLASAGDPIMTNAAGDPIMMSAAGDPIMMTTGHFTAYTFIMLTPKEYVEPDDDEPVAETDDDEPAEPDDDEPAEPDDDNDPTEPADEDIVPEPEKVYSLVPCTGFTFCVNDNSKVIECPGEGEEFYGQDAQYAIRRSCVPRSFKTFPLEEDEMQDNITGLTWLFADVTVDYTETEEHTFCTELDYDGYDDWRFPTPKELNTLAVHNKSVLTNSNVFPQTYLQDHGGFFLAVGGETNYYYSARNGDLTLAEEMSSYYSNVNYICVRGEEYGKVGENVYEESGEGSEKVVFDHSTNLLWQKGSVSGKSWKEALEYCENLEYAGYEDWRLPNRNELMTLADYSKAGTGLVSSFPGMEAEQFVVSTSSLGFPESVTGPISGRYQ